MKESEGMQKIKNKIIPVLKEYKVIKAGIFGSYARGEQKKKSDMDILIKIENGTDLIELVRLKTKLQKLIGKKIDLVEYENIKEGLKENILSDEIRII